MAQHNEFNQWDQIYRRLQQAEGLPFCELLGRDRVARAVAAGGIEYRQRVYEPIVTLWAFLSQVLSADHSCRDARRRLPVELARATGARHRERKIHLPDSPPK